MHGEWLKKPTGSISVVFVHGILSSGEKCWRHANGTYWPELLNQDPDLASLGIYIYNYQTGFASGSYSLSNVVDDLKERIFTLDGVADSKKIVFVCHSMGGIVVRKFIVERVNDFLDRKIEIGLYLVASPSLGSHYANWLEPIAQFAGHEQAKALTFTQANQWLNDLDKTFINLKESKRLSIHGKELLEDKFITLTNLFRKQVVEPFSGARYFGESFKVAGSDHFTIAKPKNNSSDQHRLLKAFILGMNPKRQTVTYQEQPSSIDRLTTPFISESGMNVSESINVFVSYSWAVEEDTKIVDELDRLCHQRGIKLIRDNNTLKHGDLIEDFMKKLSKGGHVITVFSKPYFQSKWCMYELLCIYQKGEFEQRTHPVIADDLDLQDRAYRLGLVKYWQKQYEKIKLEIKDFDSELVVDEINDAKLYRDISQKINEIVKFAADRVTTPLAELQKQNYTQLLDRIKLVEKPGDTSTQISDEDFLQEIRQSLEADLKKSEPFRDHVIQNCDRDFTDTRQLHDYLIEQSVAGQFVEIIRDLESAFVDSYDSINKNDVSALKKLYEAAENAVSKLVLFNIKNEWMMQFRSNCLTKNHHEHILPEMTFGSVEVVSSREARTIPRFYMDRHSFNLQGGKGVTLESGIRAKDVVRDVIKRLYFRVMDRELPTDLDENQAISTLQKTIQQRKKLKNLKLRKNYFLLIPTANNHSELADTDVQAKLKELLPDLSLIRIKSGSHEEIFIVEDEDLMVAIRDFFITLEEYKYK